jgi:hypothetical protein
LHCARELDIIAYEFRLKIIYVKRALRFGWETETLPNKDVSYVNYSLRPVQRTSKAPNYSPEEDYCARRIQAVWALKRARKNLRQLLLKEPVDNIVNNAIVKYQKIGYIGFGFEGLTSMQLLRRAGLWAVADSIEAHMIVRSRQATSSAAANNRVAQRRRQDQLQLQQQLQPGGPPPGAGVVASSTGAGTGETKSRAPLPPPNPPPPPGLPAQAATTTLLSSSIAATTTNAATAGILNSPNSTTGTGSSVAFASAPALKSAGGYGGSSSLEDDGLKDPNNRDANRDATRDPNSGEGREGRDPRDLLRKLTIESIVALPQEKYSTVGVTDPAQVRQLKEFQVIPIANNYITYWILDMRY